MAEHPNFIISIACDDWRTAVPDAESVSRTAAEAAFLASGLDGAGAEVGIVLSDDAEVRTLNRDYRGQDKPTNVLSFVADDGPVAPDAPRLLGDVIIAYGVAATEADEEGKTLSNHLSHLVVHGVLHLAGHDHINDADADTMESLEGVVLAGLGIDDPYRVTA